VTVTVIMVAIAVIVVAVIIATLLATIITMMLLSLRASSPISFFNINVGVGVCYLQQLADGSWPLAI